MYKTQRVVLVIVLGSFGRRGGGGSRLLSGRCGGHSRLCRFGRWLGCLRLRCRHSALPAGKGRHKRVKLFCHSYTDVHVNVKFLHRNFI